MTKHSRNSVKRKRKLNKRNLLTIIMVFLVLCELVGTAAGLILIVPMVKSTPELNVDDLMSPESSRVYDAEGNQIADVGTQLRENVSYDELSESIIDCFIAAEDSRYFVHDGFDMPRFVKAVMVNVKNILTHNSARQGGSTFTMQLVKVTYFQNDEAGTSATKDLEYKVQQIALARRLETKSNKKTILEMYLNKLNFGGSGNIRGIEKASQYYYGKSASELNLAEAAMLAGVINSPYRYDPHNFLDAATYRRNTVLNLLKQHGYITADECALAKTIKVEDTLIDPATQQAGGSAYAYQSYIDTAILEAQDLTGQDPYNVAMDIYTCMDQDVQKTMDTIQSGGDENIQFPDDLMEVGMISENNQTGEVVAIGGGRNYGKGGSMLLNHATSQYKQPGSSVKPVLDYALAFEYLGWATSHVVTDKPIVYSGTSKVIQNANGSYKGEVTLKYAVGVSLNTPAIQAMEQIVEKVGWQTVSNYIANLGFDQNVADTFDIGYAIGGSNFTCTCEQLMAAHAVLMNGGNYIKPHTIRKIDYRSGVSAPVEPVYDAKSVLSAQAAYLASTLMYDAVNTNYQNYMQLLQRKYAVYGKTGTTDWGSEGLQYNIPQGAAKDKWMVSETSQYTTVVWVGYEKGIKDQGTYFTNAKSSLNIPGKISNAILSSLTDDVNPPEVTKPSGISSITHILGTFPYAAVIEGMDSNLIATGLTKSENASLVQADTAALEVISSFTCSANEDGSLNMSWSPYPDATKLTVADSTMDISLYGSDGSVIVSATGARLFDYSWLFGPVRYKARISQGGAAVGVLSSETENSTQSLSLKAGTETQACGYYAYENDAQTSNEICVTFTTPAEKEKMIILAPSASDQATVETWCKANGVSFTTAEDSAKAGTYQFLMAGEDVTGKTIKQSQLPQVTCHYFIAKTATPQG